jgi:3,4-dihydroxy 2-butanone 4-phosphate synthase/GTP cyclohydrolase II
MSLRLAGLPARSAEHYRRTGHPLVLIAYAQSIDGSISLRAGEQSPISGPESMVFTHQLRAAHDAILIGIGTLLADDPRLTARLAAGRNPQPVVLDSRLRCPVSARLLSDPARPPWIAAASPLDSHRRRLLEDAGAQVMALPPDSEGHVDLLALLAELGRRGIVSLMVEGGAQVITSFLRQRLADHVAVTIAPVLAGGYHAVGDLSAGQWQELPRLRDIDMWPAGEDIILWGDVFEG